MLFGSSTPMIGPTEGLPKFGSDVEYPQTDWTLYVMEDGSKVLLVTDGEHVLKVTVND